MNNPTKTRRPFMAQQEQEAMRAPWLRRISAAGLFSPCSQPLLGHGRHHADHVGAEAFNRGLAKYRATSCRQLLYERNSSCSLSAKSCCLDNAVVESSSSSRKHELNLDDDAKTLNSPQDLIRDLAFWIDG
jgi:hypothetical protein